MGFYQRHKKEIDCSLAIVGAGWPLHTAMALNLGANQYTARPRLQHQSVFYDGWQHIYYCQQRQAGRPNEQSISLDVYGLHLTAAVVN